MTLNSTAKNPSVGKSSLSFAHLWAELTEWPCTLISGSSKPQLSLDFPSQLCRDTAAPACGAPPSPTILGSSPSPKMRLEFASVGETAFPKGRSDWFWGPGGPDSLLDSVLGGGSSTWLLCQEQSLGTARVWWHLKWSVTIWKEFSTSLERLGIFF